MEEASDLSFDRLLVMMMMMMMMMIFKSSSYVSHLHQNRYICIAVRCECKHNKVTMHKPRKMTWRLHVTDLGANRKAYRVGFW